MQDGAISKAGRCSEFAPVDFESGLMSPPSCLRFEDDALAYTYDVSSNVAGNVTAVALAQSTWMRLLFVEERHGLE